MKIPAINFHVSEKPAGFSSLPSGIPWMVSALLLILCVLFLILWRTEKSRLIEAEDIYELRYTEEYEAQIALRLDNEKLSAELESAKEMLKNQTEISELLGTQTLLGHMLTETRQAYILYQGIDNPVRISVPGMSADQLDISLTNAKFFKQNNIYFVNPKKAGNSILTVYATINGTRRKLISREFKVKPVPDPVPVLSNKRGGRIQRPELLVQPGIQASLENFEFDVPFTVTEFTISATDRGFYRMLSSHSNRFTEEQRSMMRSLNMGQMLVFDDIRATGPEGEVHELSPMVFRLQ